MQQPMHMMLSLWVAVSNTEREAMITAIQERPPFSERMNVLRKIFLLLMGGDSAPTIDWRVGGEVISGEPTSQVVKQPEATKLQS